MACALTACGSAESSDAVGFRGVDSGDDPVSRPRPEAKDASVDASAADALDGGATPLPPTDSGPACPIGVTRCFEYRQERCIDPDVGWSNLGTNACCLDESRFTYSSTTGAVTDAKSTLQWKREDGSNNCASPWRYARLLEIKTLLFGAGACSPDSDKRFFSDPSFCDTYGTDCINMSTGKIVPNGTGERLCVR